MCHPTVLTVKLVAKLDKVVENMLFDQVEDIVLVLKVVYNLKPTRDVNLSSPSQPNIASAAYLVNEDGVAHVCSHLLGMSRELSKVGGSPSLLDKGATDSSRRREKHTILLNNILVLLTAQEN